MADEKIAKKQIIIGLVGLPGAGKTSVAKILANEGFMILTLSFFIKEEIKRVGLKITRESLQDTGDFLRKTKRADILAGLALKLIKKKQIKKAVIDGIRNLNEIKRLKKEKNFYLMGVSANPDIRYKRLLKSNKYNSIKNWPEFVYYELRENTGISNETGQQSMLCYLNANYFIDNNTNLKDLRRKIEKILKDII